MFTYKVTVEVEYEVEARNADEAEVIARQKVSGMRVTAKAMSERVLKIEERKGG